MGGKKQKDEATRHAARLQEIAETKLGALTDDEVLEFLAERKRLAELEREYEESRKEQEKVAELQARKSEIEKAIGELNEAISPEKADDELLGLVRERQELEGRLSETARELAEAERLAGAEEAAEKETAAEVSREAAEKTVADPMPPMPPDDFGKEGIVVDLLKETGELDRYLHELSGHTGSLGMFLEGLPANIKAAKAFMLKVAEIDPAYAMHYADTALKRDEDFNVRVMLTRGKRNSGNPIAEMLPDARTANVVMAGVKQDYRNIRFAMPDMEGYREMIGIAKKGALQRVKELKESADVTLLVPKILQKDAEFMREVEKVAAGPQAEGEAGK